LAEARENSSTYCIKPQKTVVLFYSKLQLATQCLTLQTTDLAMPAALASGERRGRAATQAGPPS